MLPHAPKSPGRLSTSLCLLHLSMLKDGWSLGGKMKCSVPQPGNRGFFSLSLGLAQNRRCSAGCCLHQPASGCHSNHS